VYSRAMEANAKGDSLHKRVLMGLLIGAVLGLVGNWLGTQSESARQIVRFLADGVAHPIGQVFLRLLFLVVVPLVFASLATGVASLGDFGKVGRIGARTAVFFLLTTAFSAVLGLMLMNTLQPGTGFDPAVRDELLASFGGDAAKLQATATANETKTTLETANKWLDMFLPRNVLGAITRMEMLPLVVLSLLFGAFLMRVRAERRSQMIGWLETVAETMVSIVGFAMKLAPFAVACLIYSVVAKFGADLLGKLAAYVLIILGAYVVQVFVLYPLILVLMVKRSPIAFLRGAVPVMVTALSTSSSNATLPTSLRVAKEGLGIRSSIAGFVLPLGATLNMNGTALFEGALVLFIAQVFGIELSLGQQAVLVLMCVITAVGAAGVPGGSLPLLVAVLAQVGLPPDGIAIVLGVDRILDMGRTVVNVMGDLVCAAWIESSESSPSSS